MLNSHRVWGGGIYEEDVFYDICDELGILVWQDFMFGCGSYPTWPELLDSIRKEAVCNVQRLRHHPSIVIYAGNNEDYQIQEWYKLEYDYSNKDAESWLKTTYPARYIYEHLLPEVMKVESPNVAYWPSSPFSDGKDTSDRTIGDLHQWNGTSIHSNCVQKGIDANSEQFGMERRRNTRSLTALGADSTPSLEWKHFHICKQ
jgi:beta-mannosidase